MIGCVANIGLFRLTAGSFRVGLGFGYKCATSCEVGALGLARVDLADCTEIRDFSLGNVGSCVSYLLGKISHIAICDIFLEIVDFEYIKDFQFTPFEAQQHL